MTDDRTLDTSDEIPDPSRTLDPDALPGARFGAYTLRERIGVGGMGEVWKADQTEPIRRTVAIKLVRAGMDTSDVLARFAVERQALALMDHPNIARVFDAGTTPRGRPFFAMEYVQGIPITEYCDRRRLDTPARIELFQKVCHGVQHAHHKSVVHRDLKPSNVLVVDVDGEPVPKIIDFGVAKATSRKLADRTVYTSIGQMIGTPEYMSPEQAELTNEDVDTRADVYSLGVILYVLLVGALPFEPDDLRRSGLAEMLRILRETDPPLPSTRLAGLGERATQITQARRTEVRRLAGSIQGDLDWIVMRSIEKDRNRRYASPTELAQDLQRHLDDEPVLAGPPTARYRMSKFVRRHRAGVVASTAAIAALVAFAAFATVQARIIARERDRATDAAAQSAAMNEFLTRTIASADPWAGGMREVTVVEVLDSAAREATSTFSGQPSVEAAMRKVLGEAYLGLGRLEPASTQVTRALELRSQLQRADAMDASSLHALEARLARATSDYESAVRAATAAVRELDRDPTAPAVERVRTRHLLSRALLDLQRYAAAESVLTETEALSVQLSGPDRIHGAETLAQRGDLSALRDGDAAAADSLSRAAYTFASAIDPDAPQLATYMNNAAQYRSRSGDFEGALADFDLALELNARIFGTDHPEYATCIENRGGVYYQLGRAEDTLDALQTAYDIRARNLGPDHIDVVRTRINVGTVAMITGDHERAIAVFRELRPRLVAARGTDHPDVLTVLRNEGLALRSIGSHGESLRLLREGLEISRRMYGDDHPQTALMMGDIGRTLVQLGRLDEAKADLTRAFDVFLAKSGAEHPRTVAAAASLVELAERQGDTATAERYRAYAKQ